MLWSKTCDTFQLYKLDNHNHIIDFNLTLNVMLFCIMFITSPQMEYSWKCMVYSPADNVMTSA